MLASTPEDLLVTGDDIWIFGYGSLMWNPGFDFIDQQPARLEGYHRHFCVYSYHHRGTPEHKGLVLGLDQSGSCQGLGFRVTGQSAAKVMAYLYQRELITTVYQPQVQWIQLLNLNQSVPACCFIVDRTHEQYAGSLSLTDSAHLILNATGKGGPNWDYLQNTVACLAQLGIADPGIQALFEHTQQLRARILS